jgi:hypothetical protein
MPTASTSARVTFNVLACALVMSTLDVPAVFGMTITILRGEFKALYYSALKKLKSKLFSSNYKKYKFILNRTFIVNVTPIQNVNI